MLLKQSALVTSILLIFLVSCGESPKKNIPSTEESVVKSDSIAVEIQEPQIQEKEEEEFVLDEENAIDFFFNYAKEHEENKVKLTTSMGSFTVQLYNNVPYHKANFIYLAKKGYFNDTQFHRVVKDFIIQGGNSDDRETAKKRREIGRYLLPPDAKKGHKHHRGTISMPSSERDNPHKLASPYEFFIVVTKPGSYHLDGSYTPFGKVIEGMDVVDAINNVAVGDGDWPWKNIYILKAEVL
ncbi:peptidylprolyl isomerase [Flagellimonas hymeniacidonis]|uniref:Peptidyl-prolyl cis-trans isomerase n=1 Tax=Flagellimonas hymeniacidonis TaxID=2603628 RepID=A0A5C8V5B6_9FLAO|nr:peptidylprolyl isomerase [Flagellimonas hymeniacidonis]TXN36219.1 peptidylprolyl isomerase [Flagellimonas hymeniacidonis]